MNGEAVLTPVRGYAIAAMVTLALGLVCLVASLRQPWTGLSLSRNPDDGESLLVLATTGPSASIPAGTTLVSIHSMAGRFELRGDDIEPEPQLAFLDYAAYADFFDRQRVLAELLRDEPLILETDHGVLLEIHPAPWRPLSDLPFTFWLQLVAGLGSFLAGAGLLLFRPGDVAVRWCVVAGLGITLAACTAAVFSTRELALPLPQFAVLSALNRLGTCIAAAGFVTTLWLYPQPLTRSSPGYVLLLLCILCWIGETLQRLPTGPASSVLLAVLAFPVAVVLALAQWKRALHSLREKAALKWFLLSWLGGGGFFVFMVLVPALTGQDVGDVTPYAFGALLLTLVGLSFGVARYRLFEVEHWAFRSLLLLAGAFAVLIIDLILVNLLQWAQPIALALALLIAGWLYLPLRHWLARHLLKRTRQIDLSDLPALLRDLLTTNNVPPARILPESLSRLFAPLNVTLRQHHPLPPPGLADDGLALFVEEIDGPGVWELRMAEHGQRLFTVRDLRLAEAVRAIVERFVRHDQAIARSVEAERRRLAQDLHDDVGARLLTLLHRSSGERSEEIRGALASLRETVYALMPAVHSLADALAIIRAETADRCEAAGVDFEWTQAGELPSLEPARGWQQDLSRIMREAISNALRHANPRRLAVHLDCVGEAWSVQITNDGAIGVPDQWQPGIGLRGMRGRIQRMGGEMTLKYADGQVCVQFVLPMNPAPLLPEETA